MANRLFRAATLSVLALIGCSGPDADSPATQVAIAPPVRSADAAERGLSPDDFPRVQQLAEGVYSYEWLRPAQNGGTTNSLVVVTSDGVLVADGMGSVEETQRMVDVIAGLTDQPITRVVVSSDHGDHTGGNSAFPEDAVFIAHPTSAAVLEASAADRDEDEPPVRLATELVEGSLSLHLGEKEIQVLHLGRAHTGGDLVVYLPAEKVMFMSEVFFSRLFPSMRSSHPSEWVETIERAQAMDVDVYVPGHGFVDAPMVLAEELEAYRQAVEAVIAEATRLHGMGLSAEEAIEQADFGEYNSWAGRDRQTPRNMPRIYMELNGELPNG